MDEAITNNDRAKLGAMLLEKALKDSDLDAARDWLHYFGTPTPAEVAVQRLAKVVGLRPNDSPDHICLIAKNRIELGETKEVWVQKALGAKGKSLRDWFLAHLAYRPTIECYRCKGGMEQGSGEEWIDVDLTNKVEVCQDCCNNRKVGEAFP